MWDYGWSEMKKWPPKASLKSLEIQLLWKTEIPNSKIAKYITKSMMNQGAVAHVIRTWVQQR